VEIIAHRGSSFLAPENTLAAVELAWREGADAVECDLRLTRDGHIVAMHDASLKRTAGVDRLVADCTLDELRSYDVGSWKDPKFAGERVPTLQELLSTVPPGKRFFVELKGDWGNIEPLDRALAASNLSAKQVVFICLNADVIACIKKVLSQCPAYWIVEFRRDDHGNWQPTSDEILASAAESNFDGLDLMASGPIDNPFVARAKSAGLDLCAWTVDDSDLARRLLNLGIEGITANRPGWLRKQLATDHRPPTADH
jgi:glycerophosphoryl diester phosphodiesterase